MQYQEYVNARGERLWIPLLAGAALISAPFWFGANNNKCCNNQQYIQPVPYPLYQTNYYPNYQTPTPYPYQTPYPTFNTNYIYR